MERNSVCFVCGRPADCMHHLIFGNSRRRLADEDGLVIPLCDHHHNFGASGIHDHSSAEALSKALGQALWERDYLLRGLCIFDTDFAKYADKTARTDFIKRYGRSWL